MQYLPNCKNQKKSRVCKISMAFIPHLYPIRRTNLLNQPKRQYTGTTAFCFIYKSVFLYLFPVIKNKLSQMLLIPHYMFCRQPNCSAYSITIRQFYCTKACYDSQSSVHPVFAENAQINSESCCKFFLYFTILIKRLWRIQLQEKYWKFDLESVNCFME